MTVLRSFFVVLNQHKFSCFGNREIFLEQSDSIPYGKRQEPISRYANQILFLRCCIISDPVARSNENQNYPSYSKNGIPVSCLIEQSMVVLRGFFLVLNQPILVVMDREIFSTQSGSVLFGQRRESISKYPNQIIVFCDKFCNSNNFIDEFRNKLFTM